MDEQTSERSIHLSDYYWVLSKHKGLIITALFITVTLTAVFTFLMKPVFKATTVMVIDNEQSTSPLTGERVGFESYVSQALTFKTHFKLITSRPVLEKVSQNLKLEQVDREEGLEVGPLQALIQQAKANVKLLLKRDQTEAPLSPEDKQAQLLEKLLNKITISEVRDTRLLRISIEDHDPVTARDIANELGQVYIGFNTANRLEASQNTLRWMSGELYEMKKNLEDAEEKFIAYKEKAQLFSIGGKLDLITQKIEETNDAYLKARNRRLELEAKLGQLRKLLKTRGSGHARSLVDNPLISTLNQQLLEAEVELIRLKKIYKTKHPKIVQLNSKVNQTRRKLNGELNKEVENLKAERAVLYTKENVLKNTIAEFEGDAMQTNSKALKYNILKRNVETNQNLYDTLLSKVKESNIEGNRDVSNLRIVEKASTPLNPVKPKKKLNVLLSAIFGLMTGIGLAFFWEYLDRSLRTEDDVQRFLDIPVLSVVPIADPPPKK